MAAAVFAAVPCGHGSAAEAAQDPVRREAEALAQAASKEFGTILERQRLAQAPSGGAQERPQLKPAAEEESGAWGWWQRSRQQFQALMQLLAGGRQPPSPATGEPGKKTAMGPAPTAPSTTTAGERSGEPSPRPGVAGAATADPKASAELRARLGEAGSAQASGPPAQPKSPAGGKDQGARTSQGAGSVTADKQMAETKTAQAETSKPDAAKKPDAPRSDAPKAGAPKAEAPKADTPKAEAPKAATPKPDAGKAETKPAPPKSDAAKSDAPKADAGKADTKAATPKAGEPAGAAQGKPPASKSEGTAGTPPAGAPSATEKAPGAKTAARAAKTKARTRHAGGSSNRRATATAGTCRAAGRPIRAPGWYVVGKGDSLSAIARRHYGSGRLYVRIRAANRGRIRNPDRIHLCQRIYLPRVGRRR